jgi:hypothetical protein
MAKEVLALGSGDLLEEGADALPKALHSSLGVFA